MAKDPAFLFYPNDWLGETMGMTFELKGAYLELLMLQFNRGHMPLPLIRQVVGDLWEAVSEHFEADEDGRYYNVRLEEEVQRRRTYCASRRKNMQAGQTGEMHMPTHMPTHMHTHMETETETETATVTKAELSEADTASDAATDASAKVGCAVKPVAPILKAVPSRFRPPTQAEVAAYCAERRSGVNPQRFVDFYASKGWLVGRSPMKDWKAAIRSWEAGGASTPPKPVYHLSEVL